MKNWFDVDKTGLAQLLERRGKEFIVLELLQNCWDEPGVTEVTISVSYSGHNRAQIVVADDAPEGFKNISHAYTLFAESSKKKNAEQRGRFNLGEKLVMALCDHVILETTTGGFEFDDKGRHRRPSWKRGSGTRIECHLRLTQGEVEKICELVNKLIAPPKHIKTMLNGFTLQPRAPFNSFTTKLQTEIAGADNLLKRADRETTVTLYPKKDGERAVIYEMGIPVCETDDLWHYDIGQKVPLTLDRANVLPGFLKRVRLEVFNRYNGFLSQNDMNSTWVTEAVECSDATKEAVQKYADVRFGEKRVAYDPSDPEANHLAVSHNMTVVHGGMMSAAAWSSLKRHDVIKPAGQVTPGPKVWTGQDNPDAPIFDDWIPEEKWTKGMREIADYAKKMAKLVMNKTIVVKYCATAHHLGGASYGPGGNLTFNKFRMGSEWFEQGITVEVVDLLIHEFGHEYSLNHLESAYHDALTRIGAKVWAFAKAGQL